ncbi:MAG: sulfatase-like hydrolase/transferase [Myxococcota bacterium]|nr:sulfatase-like hydrolase/transferase [Myxococcota bacterium]
MIALTLLACSDPTLPTSPDVQPDIVLVLTSGLREDTVPGGATAQLIEATGVPPGLRFTAAYSQTVQPYIAMGSLLTGHYPSAIPLCSPPVRADPDLPEPFCVALPPEKPTMAEVLSLYGYRTAMITVDAGTLTPLARGFQEIISVGGGTLETAWSDATRAASGWWSASEGHPRLLVVAGQLHTKTLEGAGSVAHTTMAMTEAEQADYLSQNPWFNERISDTMRWPIVTEASRELVREAYEDTAQRVGAQVKGLLGELAWHRPRWTVLTALHGLTLGEDTGCRSPEQLRVNSHIVLLDRTLRVPLLVYGPTPAAHTERVEAPVELVDLMPTFTALAGAVPPAGLPGVDLRAPADPGGVAYSEFGDMLSLRHRGTMLTFRSQVHGITSADPRLTARLLQSAPISLTGETSRRMTPGRTNYYEYLMHEVVGDPLQVSALPVGEDSARFMEMVAMLLERRSGLAAPPTSSLSWEDVQDLRQEGALHYW